MKCFARETSSGGVVACEWKGKSLLSVEAAPGEEPETDSFLTAGFVDLQVNGFGGVDYNNPRVSVKSLWGSLDDMRLTGVTRCLPTVITAPPGEMIRCLEALDACKHPAIAGFHMEGPHISPEDGPRGAHLLGAVRPPDFGEFETWQEVTGGRVRLVTISPHWPDAPWYIEGVIEAGCAVSIGHTNATEKQIDAAIAAGATLSTHLGNGAMAVMPKFPNLLWQQLAHDGLTAGFIADGIHLEDSFLRAAIRAKGVDRSVLVTDASSPAGARAGRYHLGAQAIDLTEEGRVVLAGTDRLAGSALRLDVAVSHVMRVVGMSFEDAVRMVTVNPERAVRLEGAAGRNLIRLDPDVRIIAVEG